MKLYKNFEPTIKNNILFSINELKKIEYIVGTSTFTMFVDDLKILNMNDNTIILEFFAKNLLVLRTHLLSYNFYNINKDVNVLQLKTLDSKIIKYYLY